MTRLWEASHPYYCTEGNFYTNGMHDRFESWSDFIGSWGGTDPDMNFVFRWDWKRADSSDYEYELEHPDKYPGFELPGDALFIYWVLQRKAILRSTECPVTEADEPAVRAFLTRRAQSVRAIWEPLLSAGVTP